LNPYQTGTQQWWNFEISARETQAKLNTVLNPQSATNNPMYEQYIKSNIEYAPASGVSKPITIGQASALHEIFTKTPGMTSELMKQYRGVDIAELNQFLDSVKTPTIQTPDATSPYIYAGKAPQMGIVAPLMGIAGTGIAPATIEKPSEIYQKAVGSSAIKIMNQTFMPVDNTTAAQNNLTTFLTQLRVSGEYYAPSLESPVVGPESLKYPSFEQAYSLIPVLPKILPIRGFLGKNLFMPFKPFYQSAGLVAGEHAAGAQEERARIYTTAYESAGFFTPGPAPVFLGTSEQYAGLNKSVTLASGMRAEQQAAYQKYTVSPSSYTPLLQPITERIDAAAKTYTQDIKPAVSASRQFDVGTPGYIQEKISGGLLEIPTVLLTSTSALLQGGEFLTRSAIASPAGTAIAFGSFLYLGIEKLGSDFYKGMTTDPLGTTSQIVGTYFLFRGASGVASRGLGYARTFGEPYVKLSGESGIGTRPEEGYPRTPGMLSYKQLLGYFKRATVEPESIMSRTKAVSEYGIPKEARLSTELLVTKRGYVTGFAEEPLILMNEEGIMTMNDLYGFGGKVEQIQVAKRVPKIPAWSAQTGTPGIMPLSRDALSRVVTGTFKTPGGGSEIKGMYAAPVAETTFASITDMWDELLSGKVGFSLTGIRLPSLQYFSNIERVVKIPENLRQKVLITSGKARKAAYDEVSEWMQEYIRKHPGERVAFAPLTKGEYEIVIAEGMKQKAIQVARTTISGLRVPIYQTVLLPPEEAGAGVGMGARVSGIGEAITGSKFMQDYVFESSYEPLQINAPFLSYSAIGMGQKMPQPFAKIPTRASISQFPEEARIQPATSAYRARGIGGLGMTSILQRTSDRMPSEVSRISYLGSDYSRPYSTSEAYASYISGYDYLSSTVSGISVSRPLRSSRAGISYPGVSYGGKSYGGESYSGNYYGGKYYGGEYRGGEYGGGYYGGYSYTGPTYPGYPFFAYRKHEEVEPGHRYRMPKFRKFLEISPTATPREVAGLDQRQKDFYRTISAGLVAKITPASPEVLKRNPLTATDTLGKAAGMEFFRARTGAEKQQAGGRPIAVRRQEPGDVVSFITNSVIRTERRQATPRKRQKLYSANVEQFSGSMLGQKRRKKSLMMW
ncbi:MAG: hypothetical protein PHW03_09850, partial [Eubacteriales bacterium]|nr:hypothetical protein [Eubacteriales bacterium]